MQYKSKNERLYHLRHINYNLYLFNVARGPSQYKDAALPYYNNHGRLTFILMEILYLRRRSLYWDRPQGVLCMSSQQYLPQHWNGSKRLPTLHCHRQPDCLFNRLLMRRSKKTPKLRVTDLCEGNSPVIGEFPAQRASNAENVSIWWRHHRKL